MEVQLDSGEEFLGRDNRFHLEQKNVMWQNKNTNAEIYTEMAKREFEMVELIIINYYFLFYY